MSQQQPIITEEPQPNVQSPPGFQQSLPGQYPQEYPLPVQPMMQPAQPGQQMMQPAQPGQPMMQPAQPGQQMMQPAQPGQQMMQPAQPGQQMMQPAQPEQQMMQPAQPGQQMMQPAQPGQQMMQPAQPGQQMMQPAQPGQQMMQPIQMQPVQQTSNTTNVVMINQQPAAPLAPREWSTGLCGCFEDFGTCCYAIFCGERLLADISQRLGEGRCYACCCPNALVSLRIKFRTEQHIKGSLCDDQIAANCCYCLVLCQLAREVDYVQRTQRRQ